MIVDLRIYTAKPGRVPDFVAIYREYGWPLQKKYLGNCIGWFTGLEGQLNQVVHMWAYDSQSDREKRRLAMYEDPAWLDYLRRTGEADVLLHTENRLLSPTDFSPLR
jgi:hypothetical protein